MRCHYEVLGVQRDADDAEIKKSYRKMALRYHPDKNPDNVDEYTEIFREIQCAYDVLSDKQERAFYDKHREAILKGGDEFVDDSLDLMRFFNPSCHTGYNDKPDGFYVVYGDVFRTLSEEEEPYLEGDSADEYDVPEFGDSNSDYETVVAPFYSYWLGFCTRKSFVWKDKYDIRQAPNRPTQRLMEKENKKIRDQFKRKRNEEVRALVAYIRKRDRRVKAFLEEQEATKLENKRKMEEKRAEEIRKRNEALGEYKEQDWMTMDDSALDSIDAHFGGSDVDELDILQDDDSLGNEDFVEMVDEFYCIACEKTFKSEKALSNHEKSKKHKENLEMIKAEMEHEIANELKMDEADDIDLDGDDLTDDDDGGDLDKLIDGESSHSDVNDNHGDKEASDEMFKRIDSMNLTENVVLRNVIERTTSPKQQDIIPEVVEEGSGGGGSILPHATDSLKYTKQKGIGKNRQGSIKMKDKKKKRNGAGSKKSSMYDVVDEEILEWAENISTEECLRPRDSLALPRRKSKKKEVRETADRLRHIDDLVGKNIQDLEQQQATLGDSPLTDSIYVHRKKKSGKQQRKAAARCKQLFQIGDDDDDDSDEDDTESGESLDETEGNTEKNRNAGSVIEDGEKSINPSSSSIQAHVDKLAVKDQETKDNSNNGIVEKEITDDTVNKTDLNVEGTESSNKNNNKINKKQSRKNTDATKNNSSAATTKNTTESTRPDGDEHFICGVCTYEFPTRNKLFTHIKNEGHAMLKEQPKIGGKKGGKKSKRK